MINKLTKLDDVSDLQDILLKTQSKSISAELQLKLLAMKTDEAKQSVKEFFKFNRLTFEICEDVIGFQEGLLSLHQLEKNYRNIYAYLYEHLV